MGGHGRLGGPWRWLTMDKRVGLRVGKSARSKPETLCQLEQSGEPLVPCRLEKPLGSKLCARTKTATGRRVENTQVIERTLVKELGKIAP